MYLSSYDDIPLKAKLCIYGSGKRGRDLKVTLENLRPDIEMVCFIDSYKSGEIDGLEIININDIDSIEFDLIVIASEFYKDIELGVKERNMHNYYISEMLFVFTEKDLENHNLTIEKIRESLYSDKDRYLFNLMIESRYKAINNDLFMKYFCSLDYRPEQYFDYINKDKINVVIEGGYYEGMTSYNFITRFPNIENVYSFDPYPLGFESGQYKDFLINSSKFKPFDYGLHTHKAKVGFFQDGAGSRLVEEIPDFQNRNLKGIAEIPVISIDEFVEENKITKVDFIKLDIEGSELSALKGATKTIQKYRPQLAISIYHKKYDLFDIPDYLIENLKNYTHRIGHYSNCVLETVWYAIPNEFISAQKSVGCAMRTKNK